LPANSQALREFFMTIRLATDEDKDAVWAILEPMIRPFRAK
jgi:hypothetical protein